MKLPRMTAYHALAHSSSFRETGANCRELVVSGIEMQGSDLFYKSGGVSCPGQFVCSDIFSNTYRCCNIGTEECSIRQGYAPRCKPISTKSQESSGPVEKNLYGN
jgi:hypothetical protein